MKISTEGGTIPLGWSPLSAAQHSTVAPTSSSHERGRFTCGPPTGLQTPCRPQSSVNSASCSGEKKTDSQCQESKNRPDPSLKGRFKRPLLLIKMGVLQAVLSLGLGFLEASQKANLSLKNPSPKPHLNWTGSVFALPFFWDDELGALLKLGKAT